MTVLPNGYAVSRASDFIIYSVEAELIDRVVKEYGPCESNNPSHSDLHYFPSHKAKRCRCWPNLRKNARTSRVPQISPRRYTHRFLSLLARPLRLPCWPVSRMLLPRTIFHRRLTPIPRYSSPTADHQKLSPSSKTSSVVSDQDMSTFLMKNTI